MPLDRTHHYAASATQLKIAGSDNGNVEHNYIPPQKSKALPDRKPSTPEKPKRPRNCFFIFLADFHKEQKRSGKLVGYTNSEICRIASNVWNALSEDQRAPYVRRQAQESAEHRAMYPDYRYSPGARASGSIRRKRKTKYDKDEADVRCKQAAELLMCGSLAGDRDTKEVSRGIDRDGSQVHIEFESRLTDNSVHGNIFPTVSGEFAGEKTTARQERLSTGLYLHHSSSVRTSIDDEPLFPQNPPTRPLAPSPVDLLTKTNSHAPETYCHLPVWDLPSSSLSDPTSVAQSQPFHGPPDIDPFEFEPCTSQPSFNEGDVIPSSSFSSTSTSHESFIPMLSAWSELLGPASMTNDNLDPVERSYPHGAIYTHSTLDDLSYDELFNFNAN